MKKPDLEKAMKNPLFKLLNMDQIIKKGDEYYNPHIDKWLKVDEEFIGNEFNSDESKPVRRKVNR